MVKDMVLEEKGVLAGEGEEEDEEAVDMEVGGDNYLLERSP